MQKISNREIYTGVLLFSVSLLLFTIILFSFINDFAGSNSISFSQVFKRVFGLLLTVLAVRGGFQLLMRKTSGWVLSFSLLCFFAGLMAYGFIANYFAGVEIITALVIECLLILAVVFLLSNKTPQKFSFSQKNITPVLLLTGSLALLYIFIQ